MAGVQAARLRVDARKWVASKLLPRVYGEKIEHSGPEGVPLTPTQAPTIVQISVLPHGFDRPPRHAQDRMLEVMSVSKKVT